MKRIIAAFVLVVLLAALSLVLSVYANSNIWISLAIAAAKAGVVVAIFMELPRTRATTVLAFFTALGFFALLIGFTAAEVATRWTKM